MIKCLTFNDFGDTNIVYKGKKEVNKLLFK